jgi:hypothetical protein
MYTVDEHGDETKCDDPAHGEHYWRRNIGGGGAQAQRLVDAGMGYWSDAPNHTPWPEPKDYGLVQNPEYDFDDDPRQWVGDPEKIAELEAATFTLLKATYSETPGIAVYKLCSTNDGWWVTKAECASALAIWEQKGCPDVDDGYGDTIPFLRAGAAHEGFRVW